MSIYFKDAYFHIQIQAQSIIYISHRGSVLSGQSTTFWPVHSSHAVHRNSEGQTDGLTQSNKNPPAPRQLVGQSQIPPNLSQAYINSSSPV